MTGPVCVLVGAPGAGKSTVGELVAKLLRVAYRDADNLIAAAAGKTIPEIFFDDGEPAFRAMETATLDAQLRDFDGVLSLGGGVVLAEANRALLRGHPVVYLEVGFADAISRVGLGAGRPLLAMNPRATLRHLLDQRRPLYEEVAVHTVTTDGVTPQQVAANVVAALAGGAA